MDKTKKRGGLRKALIILLCIALVWGALALLPRKNAPGGDNVCVIPEGGRPLLIAHGGGNREYPDNTLEACWNAYSVDPGVMLELDGSITADGVFIMSHDTTLNRRTNATGNISDWTYARLVEERVDFSYLNDLDDDGNVVNLVKYTDYAGVEVTPDMVSYPEGVSPRDGEIFPVTTLEQVLQIFPENMINVEIKQSGDTGLLALAEAIRLTELYDAFDRVIFASFHSEITAAIEQYRRDSYGDLMYSPTYGGVASLLVTGWVGLDLFCNDPVSVLQVPMEYGPITVAGPSIIRTAHRHNISVQFWTIDVEADMRYLVELGADGVMTNLPTLLKSVYDDVFGQEG